MDQSIVNALANIVGQENVSDDPLISEAYTPLQNLWAEKVDIVVRPKNAEEISQILKIANKKKVYVSVMGGGTEVISTSTHGGGILIDTRRMNKILEVDEDAMYVLFEPGVTNGQIWGYFRDHHPNFEPPIPHRSPAGMTFTGSLLNRGLPFNATKTDCQGNNVIGLEVVLPTGDITRTGSGAFERAGWFNRYMWGPDLTGLFLGAQGTLGVVTKIASKIYPSPEKRDIVILGYDNLEDAIETALRLMKLEVGEQVQITNWQTQKVVTDPWPLKDKPATDPEIFGFYILAGPEMEVEMHKEMINMVVKDAKNKGNSVRYHEMSKEAREAKMGIPVNKPIAYYQHKSGGLLFETFYLHMRRASENINTGVRIIEKYGFTPCYLLALEDFGRKSMLTYVLLYDSKDKLDIQKMKKLNEELNTAIIDQGAIPSWPDPYFTAPLIMKKAPEYYEFLKRIKKVLDPNGIMQPGKLAL
jgi:glycolate oxidase